MLKGLFFYIKKMNIAEGHCDGCIDRYTYPTEPMSTVMVKILHNLFIC